MGGIAAGDGLAVVTFDVGEGGTPQPMHGGTFGLGPGEMVMETVVQVVVAAIGDRKLQRCPAATGIVEHRRHDDRVLFPPLEFVHGVGFDGLDPASVTLSA